jgi:hypothetical protein
MRHDCISVYLLLDIVFAVQGPGGESAQLGVIGAAVSTGWGKVNEYILYSKVNSRDYYICKQFERKEEKERKQIIKSGFVSP